MDHSGVSDGASVATVVERLAASGVEASVSGSDQIALDGMTHDSRAVAAGQLFVCLRGDEFDGHRFAPAAAAAGAAALLVDHHVTDIDPAVPQIVVADTRLAAGVAASVAWGEPSHELVTVGITGTNGKTTTAQIVSAMLDAAGQPAGVVGTLHGPRTTPEGPDLHAALRGFIADGKTSAVMEVSSHALELHRVDGTAFDVVAFSNLGHDHLDLHGTPEAYFRAKSALFTSVFAQVAVINVDDPHGQLLADTLSARDGDAQIRVVEVSLRDISDLDVGSDRHSYTWRGRHVEVGLGGSFNVSNSLLAVSIVAELSEQAESTDGGNIDMNVALDVLAQLSAVPGRFEIVASSEVASRGITVVVDYAHTPDGLETLLEAARALTDGRVIAVFGCAGRRDREKRPVMGEVAGRLADLAIATSDNPRGEAPIEIINDVIAGVAEQYRSRVTSEPDRRLAIRHALAHADRGDLVVVAGKGHESTQDLGDTIIDFDDRLVAREELARLGPDAGTTDRKDAQ